MTDTLAGLRDGKKEGDNDGFAVFTTLGDNVGLKVVFTGFADGTRVGATGVCDGDNDGKATGTKLGTIVDAMGRLVDTGATEGLVVAMGCSDGTTLGELSKVGSAVGARVDTGCLVTGALDGRDVGGLEGHVLQVVTY